MKSYLITGATGYIGSMLIKKILEDAHKTGETVQITALVRNLNKARDMFSIDGVLLTEIQFFVSDITDSAALSEVRGTFDYVIHCAATTKSAEMISHPVETVEGIVTGTRNVLELASRCKAKSMVYLSSMEVYGQIDCPEEKRIIEEELGDIDIFNVRSCYPLGKRIAENLCYSYYREYGVPVKIARLAQTFGRGILPGESRVFAQFANAACKGEDIVLHTPGNSMGNYCDIDDVLDAILLLLDKGADGEAYNVVNEENTMTIREMAELVATKVANGKIKVVVDIPEENIYGYAPATGLKLSAAKLRALGWIPKNGLETMYAKCLEKI